MEMIKYIAGRLIISGRSVTNRIIGNYGKQFPSILLAPKYFELDKYPGDLTSWKNFGVWYNLLLNGVDTLPDQRKHFYQDMVKNDKTDEEKEKVLYSYLQNNFRYVSIQLGIGGFKPLGADFTDMKKSVGL